MNNTLHFRSEGISRKPTRTTAGPPEWVLNAQRRNVPPAPKCHPHKPSQPCIKIEENNR